MKLLRETPSIMKSLNRILTNTNFDNSLSVQVLMKELLSVLCSISHSRIDWIKKIKYSFPDGDEKELLVPQRAKFKFGKDSHRSSARPEDGSASLFPEMTNAELILEIKNTLERLKGSLISLRSSGRQIPLLCPQRFRTGFESSLAARVGSISCCRDREPSKAEQGNAGSESELEETRNRGDEDGDRKVQIFAEEPTVKYC